MIDFKKHIKYKKTATVVVNKNVLVKEQRINYRLI